MIIWNLIIKVCFILFGIISTVQTHYTLTLLSCIFVQLIIIEEALLLNKKEKGE